MVKGRPAWEWSPAGCRQDGTSFVISHTNGLHWCGATEELNQLQPLRTNLDMQPE